MSVFIEFWTQVVGLEVPEHQINVPVASGEDDLSAILEELNKFSEKGEKAKKLRFVIDGSLLRGSLAEYMQATQFSGERVLRIECEMAQEFSESRHLDRCSDWVTGLTSGFNRSGFASCSADGHVRLFDEEVGSGSYRRVAAIEVADVSLSSICGSPELNGFAVARKDGVVEWMDFEMEERHCGKREVHSLGANVVSYHSGLLASGGEAASLAIWNFEPFALSSKKSNGEKVGEVQMASKRQRGTSIQENPRYTLTPSTTKKSHCSITDLCWLPSKSFHLISAHTNSTLTLWDVVSGTALTTWHCPKGCSGVSCDPKGKRVATTHVDGSIRCWDLNENNSNGGGISLYRDYHESSHERWSTSASWRPNDEHTFATSSLDGHLKIFDLRNEKAAILSRPLSSVKDDKQHLVGVLCVVWVDSNRIVCGCDDGSTQVVVATDVVVA